MVAAPSGNAGVRSLQAAWLTLLLLTTNVELRTVRHLRAKSEDRHRAEMLSRLDPAAVKKAYEHNQNILKQWGCHRPQPRVVTVQDLYPDASKTYIPHCTVLHRCNDETGCCGQKGLRCVATEFEPVVLYFYAMSIDGKGAFKAPHVEKLTFTNHTRCGCVEPAKILLDDLQKSL